MAEIPFCPAQTNPEGLYINACLMYLLYKNPSPLNFTIPVWHYHTVDAVIHEPVKNTILETQPPIIIIAAQNATVNVIILNINMTNNICDSTAQNETLNLKYSSQDELVKKKRPNLIRSGSTVAYIRAIISDLIVVVQYLGRACFNRVRVIKQAILPCEQLVELCNHVIQSTY